MNFNSLCGTLTDRSYDHLRIGDVVIAWNPNNPSKTVCKRIAATAGEVILITRDFSSKKAGKKNTGEDLKSTGNTPENYVRLEALNIVILY